MHDFHIADKISRLVVEHATKNKLKTVEKIVIELGEYIEHDEAVLPENLKFNINLLLKNTFAEGAEVIINPMVGKNEWVLKEIIGE